MAKQIFVSYGREQEVQAFVTRLKHDLESNGFSVWLDIEDIPAGSDWHAAIGSGLHNCRGLIAVITNKYLCSRYCASELYTADSDQKSIFPVIFEDVNFEQSEKSMGVKYVIGGINWSFFRPKVDDYASSLTKLMQGMNEQGLVSKSVEDVDSVSNKVSQLGISPAQHGAPTSPQPVATATSPYTSPHSNQSIPGGSAVSYPHQPHALLHPSPPHPYYPHHQFPPSAMPPNTQYPSPPPPTSGVPYPQSTSPVPFYPSATPSHHHLAHPPTYYPPPPVTTAHFPTPYPVPPYNPSYSPQYPAAGYAPPPSQGYGVPYATNSDNPAPPQYSHLFPEHQPNEDSLPEKVVPATETEVVASTPSPPTTSSKKQFRMGMKLEALDRRFPYYVCVATIMDRKDNGEVRVHFDGWGPEYDYWCHSDDIELHPVGWCSQHKYELQPTLGIEWQGWNKYLTDTQSEGADSSYFNEVQLAGPGSLHFKPGMRLEAKNRLQSGEVGVATISRITDGRLLINFDGWSSKFDFWCPPFSTDIHPAMWSSKHNMTITAPNGHVGKFLWNHYLRDPGINPAPAHVFTKEQLGYPSEGGGPFEVGMKLEAKDRAHPGLTCVATITNKNGDRLLIHFDGWSNRYDYWCQKTTTDIHPVGWCRDHSHALQQPNGYSGNFSWKAYLKETGSRAVPEKAFTHAQRK